MSSRRRSIVDPLDDDVVTDKSPPVHISYNFFAQLFGFAQFPKCPDDNCKHTAKSFAQVQTKFQVSGAGRNSTLISLEKPDSKYFIGNYQNITLQVLQLLQIALSFTRIYFIIATHEHAGTAIEDNSSTKRL